MEQFSIVGKDVPRNDARVKATGFAEYTDDMKLPGFILLITVGIFVASVGFTQQSKRMSILRQCIREVIWVEADCKNLGYKNCKAKVKKLQTRRYQ